MARKTIVALTLACLLAMPDGRAQLTGTETKTTDMPTVMSKTVTFALFIPHMTWGGKDYITGKQKAPLPPAGEELSTVRGVSIVRSRIEWPGIGSSGWGYSRGNSMTFKASKASLRDALEELAPVESARIFARAPLPDGQYTISVTAPGRDAQELFVRLARAYEQAFGLRIHVSPYAEPIVIVRKGKRWDEAGMTPVDRTTKDPFEPAMTRIWTTGWNKAARTTFRGDMEALRSWLADSFGKPVVNETGIEGVFRTELTYDSRRAEPEIRAALGNLGLTFVDGHREQTGLFIEGAAAAPTRSGTKKGPAP